MAILKRCTSCNNNGDIADFNEAKATDSFNLKTKIMIPLKYLSNFW